MALQLGFPRIEVIPFSDENFTPNPGQLVAITPNDFDTADEVTFTTSKNTTTLIRGSGGKEVYTNPNEESGIAAGTLLNPINDRLQQFLFPDAIKTIDGTKIKLEIFDRPGLILSKWNLMYKVIVKPLDEQGNVVAENLWLTFPRAVLVPTQTDSFSATPGKTELQIISLGGRDEGSVAQAIGDVDLSSPVDLSAGATDKLLDITLEGTLYANINLGQAAATTGTQIVDAINTAVGTIVASINASNFLQIDGFQAGGNVIVDDPSSGTSAFTLVYKSGGGQPDSVNGSAPFDVPVVIRGDETAT